MIVCLTFVCCVRAKKRNRFVSVIITKLHWTSIRVQLLFIFDHDKCIEERKKIRRYCTPPRLFYDWYRQRPVEVSLAYILEPFLLTWRKASVALCICFHLRDFTSPYLYIHVIYSDVLYAVKMAVNSVKWTKWRQKMLECVVFTFL